MKEKTIKFYVQPQFDNWIFDEYIKTYFINLSYINNLINLKKIKINDNIIKSSNEILKNGDILEITFPIDEIIPCNEGLNILYEDDWIIAVNKEADFLVHSDGEDNKRTLMNAVYNYLSKSDEAPYAYPIHRLDYETTGIVIFAKNRLTLSFLSVEIEKREVKKEYVCLCYGKFRKHTGIINAPIGKNRHNNQQFVNKKGKTAETQYAVLYNGDISKVLVKIKQGRKHQIRVHMSYINHPICGDKLYGNDTEGKLKLHFKKIEFIHPYTRNKIVIESEEEF